MSSLVDDICPSVDPREGVVSRDESDLMFQLVFRYLRNQTYPNGFSSPPCTVQFSPDSHVPVSPFHTRLHETSCVGNNWHRLGSVPRRNRHSRLGKLKKINSLAFVQPQVCGKSPLDALIYSTRGPIHSNTAYWHRLTPPPEPTPILMRPPPTFSGSHQTGLPVTRWTWQMPNSWTDLFAAGFNRSLPSERSRQDD